MRVKQTPSLRLLLLSGLILSLFALATSDSMLLALLQYGKASAEETAIVSSTATANDPAIEKDEYTATSVSASASSASSASNTEEPTYLPAAVEETSAEEYVSPENTSSNLATVPDTTVAKTDTATGETAGSPASSADTASSSDKHTDSDSSNNPVQIISLPISATPATAASSSADPGAKTPATIPATNESGNSDAATQKTAASSPVDTSFTAGAAEETTPQQQDLDSQIRSQISDKLTEDKKICLEFAEKPDGVSFRMEGPVNKNILTYEPSPLRYCANLMLSDFVDGSYKLTIEVKGGEFPIYTRSLEIDSSNSSSALAQKAAELENKCSQNGAASSEECKQYYLDKYAEKVNCRDMEDEECDSAIKDSHINEIVRAEKAYERISEEAENILGKSMTAGKLENLISRSNGKKVLDFNVPLKKKETEIKIIPSYESVILGKHDGLVLTAPIVAMLDSDGDGVSDDIENRLGTEPDNKDTDGDGYTDSEEIRYGYDPLGEGKRDLGLSAIERMLIEGAAIEQPTSSGEQSASLAVEEVKIVYTEDGEEDGYVIAGKGEPDSLVVIYIYSDVPVVATVKTDASGNWEYHFEKTLESGNHEIYIATNDDTGKIAQKSSPLSFLIEEAQAATNNSRQDAAPENRGAESMVNYYLYAAGGMIILGIIIFLVVLSKSRNKTAK